MHNMMSFPRKTHTRTHTKMEAHNKNWLWCFEHMVLIAIIYIYIYIYLSVNKNLSQRFLLQVFIYGLLNTCFTSLLRLFYWSSGTVFLQFFLLCREGDWEGFWASFKSVPRWPEAPVVASDRFFTGFVRFLYRFFCGGWEGYRFRDFRDVGIHQESASPPDWCFTGLFMSVHQFFKGFVK